MAGREAEGGAKMSVTITRNFQGQLFAVTLGEEAPRICFPIEMSFPFFFSDPDTDYARGPQTKAGRPHLVHPNN